jgi:DNA-binding transcriptional LysR family regulator
MDLRQLEYFVAVAEEAHFTRAAERIPIAQPAISQQIRRLEAELGEVLFVRDRRAVRLTAAGEALLPHARATLSAAERARQAVAGLSGLLTGRLAIGLVQTRPHQRVAHLLGEFRRRHPAIDLAVVEDHTDGLLAALASGELDAALIGLGPYHQIPPALDSMPVAHEPLVVAVHPDHPLAARSSVQLSALRHEPLVTLTAGSGLRTTIEAACHAAGFTPRIAAETSDLTLLVDLAAEQVGIAILPQSVPQSRRLTRLELVRPKLRRSVALAWPAAAASPATRALVELARQQLASQ